MLLVDCSAKDATAALLPLQVQGGGNCANALTAAARLGLKPTIVTKVHTVQQAAATCVQSQQIL